MKILKSTDLICFEHEGIKLKVSPLTYIEKINLLSDRSSDRTIEEQTRFTVNLFRNCIKEVTGIKCHDDKDYELDFDQDGKLTEQCALELINFFDLLPANQIATNISKASFGRLTEEFSVLGK